MKNNKLAKFWLFSLIAVLAASAYPAYMLFKVVYDMICYGTVYAENYPKYIIPYTPIAVAVIVGVAFMPLIIKAFKKYALLFATALSTALFFISEFVLESAVTVTRTVTGLVSTLEGWQMYMCYVPPQAFEERTWTEVDVLMGEYSPAFKLHFYIISVVLIVAILNCFYGFAKEIMTGDCSRRKALTVQSAATVMFLGMCILACFTAFFRNGDITVSALSAALMIVFFVLFGVTVGVYLSSFLLRKRRALSVLIPSLGAIATTVVMYVGEMILLSGHLYRFGEGFFFESLPLIILAPVDLAVILASGAVTALIAEAIRNK